MGITSKILTSETRALIDANLVEAYREFGRWQHSSQLVEKNGVLLVAGTTSFPLLMNYVVRFDSQIAASTVIDEAKRFFNALERGFSIVSRGQADRDLEAAAADAGMEPVVAVPWMVLDHQVAEPQLPPNVEIKRVTDEQGILDAQQINADAFESLDFPRTETEAIFGVPARLLSPNLRVYVAYLDGEPVSTAMLLLTPQIAGVYWVGTKPSARGHGLAEACCRLASNAGFSAGAKWAVLQASPMGEPVYQRIGYRTMNDQFKCYLAAA
ncbi:GNAT family N-acetyltransferase [Leptolyngbyaceae cyanobacterium CCMR0081]|uniref:GNAT family N-acetyltransferase n=1 Tax=Adonisia turfae CCMR0081 TaxID=2292702 RepID=A0A6M0RY73_9CYAN|nr:GNAT family N-acetyltransferase [Adonisia turfae CCMR0081]